VLHGTPWRVPELSMKKGGWMVLPGHRTISKVLEGWGEGGVGLSLRKEPEGSSPFCRDVGQVPTPGFLGI